MGQCMQGADMSPAEVTRPEHGQERPPAEHDR